MGWTVNAPTVSLWVIYENLGDYPGKWVVRRWNISAGQVLAEIVPVGQPAELGMRLALLRSRVVLVVKLLDLCRAHVVEQLAQALL